MKNLMTQKFVFGLLMALVLALGVQGVADALTFGTSRSGDLATKGINEDFTISFSVSLGSNTTAVRNKDGKLISAPSEGDAVRINSSGYNVFDATVTKAEVRVLTTQPTSTNVLFKDPKTNTMSTNPATGSFYAIGSRIVDSAGHYVYIRSGSGNLTSDPPSPYTYVMATLANTGAALNNTVVPNADRYHYNDERVNIAVTNANIIKVGSTSIASTANLTLRETVADSTDARANPDAGTKLTSSVTLTLRADNAAVVEIDITDTTPANDHPGSQVGEAPQQDFTVYVVQGPGAVSGATTSFDSDHDGVEYGYAAADRQLNENDVDEAANSYFDFTAQNAPVYYTVEGNGSVYIKVSSTRKTTPTKTLHTSSQAPVYLDINGGTSKVTAYVAGGSGSKSAVFIFDGLILGKRPKIAITGGNGQTGVTGGRLEEYLEVKVTDGNGRAVPGVAVKFNATNSDTSQLIAVPGTKVYVTGLTLVGGDTLGDPINAATFTATGTKPAAAAQNAPMYVQTDSSGLAKAYFQLGTTTNNNVLISASLEGIAHPDTSKNFNATGTADSRAASLTIVSGDSQSGTKGNQLGNPLVVRARSTAGYRIPNVVIQFRSVTGTFTPSVGTQQPTEDTDGGTLDPGKVPQYTPNPPSGQQIYVITGSNGEASVTYNVGQTTVARDVIAEVRFEQALDPIRFRD